MQAVDNAFTGSFFALGLFEFPQNGVIAQNEDKLPGAISLNQNYPNPFNAFTTITYNLPRSEHLSLRALDRMDREVAVLKDGFVEAGSHGVTFEGSNLASGIYFVRLDAGKLSQTKKLMLLK